MCSKFDTKFVLSRPSRDHSGQTKYIYFSRVSTIGVATPNMGPSWGSKVRNSSYPLSFEQPGAAACASKWFLHSESIGDPCGSHPKV